MPKRAPRRDDFDSPWKDALQFYLRQFLSFFFPAICDDVDWSRSYEALDKEFQQIIRRAKAGKAVADKLFKIWLRDGGQTWLLIHVEVQGTYESEFPARMFDYNVAAYRLYNQEVVSLALLCDDNPDWKPTAFGYGRWGCYTGIQFLTAKLRDHAGDLEALETSDNPFAAVVLAHVQTLQTRGNPASRYEWKLRVAKGLYKRNWPAEDVRQIFRLIDWMMELPEDIQESFRDEMLRYEEENVRPYITSIERLALKEGREEGVRATIAVLCMWLEGKFGPGARKLFPKIRKLQDLTLLTNLSKVAMNAKTLAEVREQLATLSSSNGT